MTYFTEMKNDLLASVIAFVLVMTICAGMGTAKDLASSNSVDAGYAVTAVENM